MLKKPVEKILIVRLGAIGDVLHVLPSLSALRHNFPDAHISWIIESASHSILKDHPLIDEVIHFPRKEWTKEVKKVSNWPNVLPKGWRFFKELKKCGFDLSFDFQGNLRSGIVSKLSGAKTRVGFHQKSSREGNHRFNTILVKVPTHPIHKIKKNLLLLEAIGLHTDKATPILPENPEFAKTVKGTVAQFKRPIVVVHSGCSKFGKIKQLPLENYAETADCILDKVGGTVLLTWGPGEKKGCEKIRSLVRNKEQVVIADKSEGLIFLCELFKQVDLVIGLDTGPLHLAGIIGTPTLGLYGPKDPVIYGPMGKSVFIIKTKETFDCMPCNLHTCLIEDKNGFSPCMTTITPKAIAKLTVKLLLSSKSKTNGS